MIREKEAVYFHNQKIGYRAEKDGDRGLAYMKDDKVIDFKPTSELLKEIFTGPCIKLK